MKAAALRLAGMTAGLSAEELALVFAVSLVLGVFPVYGLPTLLCAATAAVLRLNLPAMQVINQLTSPLQLALLIPLNRVGAGVHRTASALPSIPGIAGAACDAVIGRFCLCVPLGVLLYFLLIWALRWRGNGAFAPHGPITPLAARAAN